MPTYRLRPGSNFISKKPSLTPQEGDSPLSSRCSQRNCSVCVITLTTDYLLVASCLPESARAGKQRPCGFFVLFFVFLFFPSAFPEASVGPGILGKLDEHLLK